MQRTRRIWLAAMGGLVGLLSAVASAQVPRLISYQGKLSGVDD